MSRRGENIYKRKDGRWEGRILKPDGHYQYVYGKNYREVKEKKTSLAGVKNSPEDIRNLSHSATVLFDSWLVNCAAERVKCSTYDSYYYCVQNTSSLSPKERA